MKIAHVNADPGTGPLRNKGAAVHVLALRRAFSALGANVLAVDAGEDGPGAVRSQLERGMAPAAIDLVYERYALCSAEAFAFARRNSLPFVLEVNAPLEQEARRYRGERPPGAQADLRAEMFRGADLVVAVSSAVARYAIARGTPPARVALCPNAVDAERFVPRGAGGALRAELAPEGSLVLGFHGRLRPWHNVGLLCASARALIDEGHAVQVVFVGEGPFAQTAAAALPAERYTLRGWVPHERVGAFVACFDALPLTHSRDAPFYFSPLKLLEAMAAGVVPVVPRLGDLPRVVEHERTGLLYEADDAGELTAALRRLIERPDERDRMARAAHAAAVRHTWRDVAREVLERVLGRVPA